MTRNSVLTIKALSAMFLALTAQSLLLIPSWQNKLTPGFLPALAAGMGIVTFAAAIWQAAYILLDYSATQNRPVQMLNGSLLFGFIVLYVRAGLYIEGALLTLVLCGYTFSIFQQHRQVQPTRDLVPIFIAGANIALGVIMIAARKLLPDGNYEPILNWQVELGGTFFLTGVLAFISFLRKTRRKIFTHFLALPWLVYGVLFLKPVSLPNVLPALLFASLLALTEHFPWQRVVLPSNNAMGRYIFSLAAGSQAILLVILAGLLYLGEAGKAFESTTGASREVAFLFSVFLTAVTIGSVLTGCNCINDIVQLAGSKNKQDSKNNAFCASRIGPHLAKMLVVAAEMHNGENTRLTAYQQKIQILENQIAAEKRHTAQLLLLNELSKQLESQLDQPVAAQLAVNTIERAIGCGLAVVLLNEPERREFSVMAAAGPHRGTIPAGYRQNARQGLIGRTARLRKTQVVDDTRLDFDHMKLSGQEFLSEICVPLIHNGHLKGILLVDSKKVSAFNNSDVELVEAVGAELLRAWERSSYNQRLTNLIEAGVSLSTLFDPQSTIQQIAAVSRKMLEARFTFVTLIDQERNFTHTAHSGSAPELLEHLTENPTESGVLQTALKTSQILRVRDARKYQQAVHLKLDLSSLNSMLAIPINLHRLRIGVILAFGKNGELFFSENDESLASLLSSQAAAAIESAWLYQELRSTLNITTQLYQLSSSVIQADELDKAGKIVAETAYRLAKASAAGIVLFTRKNQIEAEIKIDATGAHRGEKHPKDLIKQARKAGQSIFLASDQVAATICYPLQTPLRNYGALWLEIPDSRWFNQRHSAILQTLANQAAVALERAILLVESRQQAKAIESAYRELESTYDQTLAALTSALDARDQETQGHSQRVGQIAIRLGQALGLSAQQLKTLERGSLLHDIGKIGIGDAILHKPGPLTEDEWRIMRMHPEIGARIVTGIPFLEETLPIIRYHQERWNGSGYPVGLQKNDIPTLARLFAIADVFDALTSTRPYREKYPIERAVAYLHEQAGILFDDKIVQVFEKLVEDGKLADLLVAP